jgi:hypothetical protein
LPDFLCFVLPGCSRLLTLNAALEDVLYPD